VWLGSVRKPCAPHTALYSWQGLQPECQHSPKFCWFWCWWLIGGGEGLDGWGVGLMGGQGGVGGRTAANQSAERVLAGLVCVCSSASAAACTHEIVVTFAWRRTQHTQHTVLNADKSHSLFIAPSTLLLLFIANTAAAAPHGRSRFFSTRTASAAVAPITPVRPVQRRRHCVKHRGLALGLHQGPPIARCGGAAEEHLPRDPGEHAATLWAPD